ncbi:MAG: glycosyltransferase [Desulfovibrio sp.]|jgi:glycosyltransferase involved in cell wall biosynthesis|nr:glycosyltransferase [Desulfovibrio sp.]
MKYSIITATYNAEKFLERALASILSQSYPNFEWVIQDGGSTDNTLNILKKHPDVRLKIRSEPDKGVYDAWNKAVARATGDWAIFLGSDDCFVHTHALAQCQRHLRNLPDTIQFAFGAMLQGRDGQTDHLYNHSLRASYHRLLNNMGIPFPATFVRISLLKQEKFDVRYKIAGDYDYAARLVTKKNLARIPVLVSYMERGGVSEDCRGPVLSERMRVIYTQILPRAKEFVTGCLENLENETDFLEDAPKD